MKDYIKALLLFSALFISLTSAYPLLAHSHHETDYVPWGTDEFELFGLTRPELAKKFKNVLEFDRDYEVAYLTSNSGGPQFLLSFTNNKVSKVQRMFIDGGGCRIMGPVLNSKREAAEFSKDGLEEIANIKEPQLSKLAQAKKCLEGK